MARIVIADDDADIRELVVFKLRHDGHEVFPVGDGAAAVVLPPRGVVYGAASGRVFETIRTVVPVLEQLYVDEAFGEPAELAGSSTAAAGSSPR